MKIAGLDKCNLKGSKYFYQEERPKWAWHVIINASDDKLCTGVTLRYAWPNLNINSWFNLPSRRLESRLSTRPRMRSTLWGIISPSLTFSITIFIFRHLICDAVLWEATDYTPTSFFSAAWCLREAKREVDNNSVEKDDSDDVDLQNEAKTKRYNYQISFFSHEDKPRAF